MELISLIRGTGGISFSLHSDIFRIIEKEWIDRVFTKKRLDLIARAAFGDEEAQHELDMIREEEFFKNQQLYQIAKDPIKRKEIDSTQVDLKEQVKARLLRLLQHSARQPQSDIKSTRLAAMMPVPPMINMKGGQFCVLRLGA